MVSEPKKSSLTFSMGSHTRNAPISFKHVLSVKLDNENHLLWKQQVLAAVRGHNLTQFLESSNQPVKFVSDQDESAKAVTQEFLEWEQQDQLLVSWLLSSMTEGILTRMVGAESAHQIWSKLNLYFAAQNRAKVSQFKLILQNTKKGSLTINEYLLKVKNVIDKLASVGHQLTDTDHIEAIFNGLPEEYDTFVISVSSRAEIYSVEEIESLLLAQEARIEKHSKNLDSASVNLAAQKKHYKGRSVSPTSSSSYYHNHNRGYSQGQKGKTHHFGRNSGNRFSMRNGTQNWNTNFNNSNKLQCQVCGKSGHTALDCWHRFDQDYQSGVHQPQSSMAAMVARSYNTPDPNWYPDSGATNHITPDINNLTNKSHYSGLEQIHIGDGSGLEILHTGSMFFSSRLNPRILSLKHLLHVPKITKNLLSVSKFASDNNVFFEFFPKFCYVKDQATKEVLMAGKLKEGLYVFDSPQLLAKETRDEELSPATAGDPSESMAVKAYKSFYSSTSSNSFTLWHNRLGHPGSLTVKKSSDKM